MAGNVRRCSSVTVNTTYGPAECFGGDGHGQVLLCLHYGQAPEYEPPVPADARGKYYFRLVPENVVLEREA
jgi:hypothetical protein